VGDPYKDRVERLFFVERLLKGTADFVEGSSTHFESMMEAKLLEATPELPALRDKDAFSGYPLVYSPEGYYLMYTQFYRGVQVNTKLVKPTEEPRAWVDLLDPKWKGKIIITNPLYNSAPDQIMLVFTKAKILNENYTTEDKVRELIGLGDLSILGPEIGEQQDFNSSRKNNCRRIPSSPQALHQSSSHEYASHPTLRQSNGEPRRVCIPDNNGLAYPSTIQGVDKLPVRELSSPISHLLFPQGYDPTTEANLSNHLFRGSLSITSGPFAAVTT
jgi:hypothetical protein